MRIFVFVLLLSTAVLCAAEQEWKLEKEDQGMVIYSRVVADSEIREVKATAVMPGTIDEALFIIFDRKSHPKTMPYITKSVVLYKDKDCDISYNVVSPPLVSNRDYIVKSCAQRINDREVKLWWELAEHKDYPETKDNVRIKINKGYYVFKQKLDDILEVDYYIYTDPGGSLPLFIKNTANRTGVSDVLTGLYKAIQNRRKK